MVQRGGAVALGVAVAVLSSCGTVVKPPAPDRTLKMTTKGSLFEGGNGYRFVALPDPAATVIEVDVRYPIGMAHDPAGKEGLAHLVEHLVFQEEIERGGRTTSIGAELSRVGSFYNAWTATDYTHYVVQGPPAALGELLTLQSEMMVTGCKGLSPERFAREREVVLNELRQRQGAGGAALQRAVHQDLYPGGHPYAKTDSVESVARLELADVCAFLDGPYRKGAAIVVVSGRVEKQAVAATATAAFGRVAPRDTARVAPPAPVAPRPGKTRLVADVEQPMLYATWPLPSMSSREYRMLETCWGSIAHRLGRFAFEYKWGFTPETLVLGGHHAPILAIGITLASLDKQDEAIDAFQKSIEFAFRQIYHSGDHDRNPVWMSKLSRTALDRIATYETLDGRASLMADYLMYDDDPTRLIAEVQDIVATKPAEARRVAEEVLDPSRARYLLIEPSRATRRGARLISSYGGGGEAHGVEVDLAEADRPLAVPADPGLALEFERFRAGNGLDVVLWPHGALPVVRGALVIDSGEAHAPSKLDGIAQLHGADDVVEDQLVFRAARLATQVDDAVSDLAIQLRSPGYEFTDDMRDYLKGVLAARRAGERRRYVVGVLEAVYGASHPYARPTLTEQSLEAIGRDDAMDWAREHIVPKNATLVLAGQFDPALVKRHIAYQTDQVDDGADSRDVAASPAPTARTVIGEIPRVTPLVELLAAFPGGLGFDAHHPTRMVAEAIIASRLGSLRGALGLTYGFHASYEPRRAGGLWWIGGTADAGRAAEAARAFAAELETLRGPAAGYRAAFVLARRKVVQALLSGAGDSSAARRQLVEMVRFDLPADHYDVLVAAVARMTLADVERFMKSELAADRQVLGVFGNPGPARAAAAALRGR